MKDKNLHIPGLNLPQEAILLFITGRSAEQVNRQMSQGVRYL